MERLKREMQTLERDIKKAKNGKSVAEEKEGVPEAKESLRGLRSGTIEFLEFLYELLMSLL